MGSKRKFKYDALLRDFSDSKAIMYFTNTYLGQAGGEALTQSLRHSHDLTSERFGTMVQWCTRRTVQWLFRYKVLAIKIAHSYKL